MQFKNEKKRKVYVICYWWFFSIEIKKMYIHSFDTDKVKPSLKVCGQKAPPPFSQKQV